MFYPKYILIFVSFLFTLLNARTFTRCDLAQELLDQGFPCDTLSNWICLVESESARNTSALGILNGRGKFYHGLFQISEEYWCKKGRSGGGCNVTCESLVSDDISVAANCAMKIYERRGFEQWAGWKIRCAGKSMDLNECALTCSENN